MGQGHRGCWDFRGCRGGSARTRPPRTGQSNGSALTWCSPLLLKQLQVPLLCDSCDHPEQTAKLHVSEAKPLRGTSATPGGLLASPISEVSYRPRLEEAREAGHSGSESGLTVFILPQRSRSGSTAALGSRAAAKPRFWRACQPQAPGSLAGLGRWAWPAAGLEVGVRGGGGFAQLTEAEEGGRNAGGGSILMRRVQAHLP